MADMRKCIGSAKFGIEAHEAPVTDFPAQPSQKDGLGRMCKPHWNEYTSALRKAALARKAAERRGAGGGRADGAGAHRGARADPDAGQARRQGDRAGRLVRRATPDSSTTSSRPSGPGRQPGALLRSVAWLATAVVIAATWANVGAHGPTWADPRSATGIIRETRPRAHIREARSARKCVAHMGYPTPVGRCTLRRVARSAEHGAVRDVEGRTASGERDDVIDGQVDGTMGGSPVARAPVAVLAAPGTEHAGAETLPDPRAVQGVVAAAVGLAGVLGAAATGAASDYTTDRAQLHPRIVGRRAGAVYSPRVLGLEGQRPPARLAPRDRRPRLAARQSLPLRQQE